MIRSFRHKPLKQLWETGLAVRLPPERRDKILRMLMFLDRMKSAKDMKMAPWRLHPLKGDRKEQWSVRVTGNYRITFRFEEGNVYDVDFVDYH